MIHPHGGTLINKNLPEIEKQKILGEKDEFVKIPIDSETKKVIKSIAFGIFSPLEGFMNENDTLNVLDHMYLESNIAWPFPIVLDISKEESQRINIDDHVILTSISDGPIALLKVEDIYDYNKKIFAEKVYGTNDINHPGVAKLFSQKEKLIGGEIFLINEFPAQFPELDLKPIETRVLFKTRGWDKVVAFQTRNPPHLGHEYIQKAGLTFVDGLFINPVIGKKKTGDFRDEVIINAYKALIENYYPQNRVVLSTFETEMRYAGPKEAIFHAIARKNFGCDHIIIGRDHAGVGNYYGPYDAHKIFENFPDLGIEPLFFRSFSYCSKCNSIVNDKICPHSADLHKFFSGSQIRDTLLSGKQPQSDVMRPEIANIILNYKNPFCE
ncbi:MAG: sulfate adenylyltransferase [Candidatus Lokiarchaeota archaeon]|nr:sulfate adenylyltransferase [Candidatus Lokiarchaeota archaeon]